MEGKTRRRVIMQRTTEKQTHTNIERRLEKEKNKQTDRQTETGNRERVAHAEIRASDCEMTN